MALITRAKAKLAAKDNNVTLSKNPSSSTTHFDRSPLEELSISSNEDQAKPPMDDGIDAEIKGLKAAFRDAIGAGSKKRKNRNRKRNAKQNQLTSAFEAEGSRYQNACQDENAFDTPSRSKDHFNQEHVQAGELGLFDALKAKLTSPTPSPKPIDQRASSGSIMPTLRRSRQQSLLEAQSLDAHAGRSNNLSANTTDGPWLKLNMGPRSFSDTIDAGIEHNMHSSTSPPPKAGASEGHINSLQKVPEKNKLIQHYNVRSDGSMLEMSEHLQGSASAPKMEPHTSYESSNAASTTASPVKRSILTLTQIEMAEDAQKKVPRSQKESDDSFVAQTTSRSPTKPVKRIEDNIEKLDEHQDEVEAVLGFTNMMDRGRPKSQEPSPALRNSCSRLSYAISPTTNALAQIAKSRNTETTQQMKIYYRSKIVDDGGPSKHASAMRSTESNSSGKTVTFDENIEQSPHYECAEPTKVTTSSESEYPSGAVTVSHVVVKASSKNPSSLPRIDFSTEPQSNPELRKTKSMPLKESKQIDKNSRPTVKSLLPPKQLAKTVKPTTRPAFELPGDAVARKLKEQREARLSQRDSGYESPTGSSALTSSKRTIKSSKPPTKPAFELPGEEVSRKKREVLKARLEAEEAEEKRRREFKAKPLRKSTSVAALPRDTAASRARQARLGQNTDEENSKLERPFSHLSLNKRASTVGMHRPSIAALDRASTPTVRLRAPGPAATASASNENSEVTRVTSSPGDCKRTMTSKRGKEIYQRAQHLSEEIEAERREREDAARRARAEAAEKGRQASREWAEKQRAKKAEDL